jgi:hypothetical protein
MLGEFSILVQKIYKKKSREEEDRHSPTERHG